MSELQKIEELCYKFANHFINSNNLPLTTWAVMGANLLLELQSINPEKYNQMVKDCKTDKYLHG